VRRTPRQIVLEGGYDAFNRDDFDVFAERLHPEVEWHSSGAFPGLEPVYHGPDGVREWWGLLRDPFESFVIEPELAEEHGDALLTAVNFRAVGRGSGVEVVLPFAHVFWFEGELVRRFRSFTSLEEARAALDATGP
jgi:ketosteroid isomerase-like protein